MPVKEMFVLQEKLERLLADATVGQEANDTHSRSDQKVNHGALVLVIRRQSFLPETRSHLEVFISSFLQHFVALFRKCYIVFSPDERSRETIGRLEIHYYYINEFH